MSVATTKLLSTMAVCSGLALGGILLGASTTAHAQTAGESTKSQQAEAATPKFNLENPPALVRALVRSPEEIQGMFETQMPGVYGWVLVDSQNPMEPQILYTSADGLNGFAGTMLGQMSDGKIMSYTVQHLEKYAPKTDLGSYWADIEASNWVAEGAKDGAAKKTIYGFFDANCIYCHLSWLAMKPYMDAGLQIRWLPVAMLAETSAGKAAAILSAEDPAALMQAGHLNWEDLGREEAFPTVPVTSDIQDKLDENGILMRKLGVRGTPAFIYKDEAGSMKLVPGMPKLAEIPAITGIPEIPNNNPKLERFR